MSKPKNYRLRQMPTSCGYMQASLNVYCFEDGQRSILIRTNHDIELKPRSARALAKRLLDMANWVESEVK